MHRLFHGDRVVKVLSTSVTEGKNRRGRLLQQTRAYVRGSHDELDLVTYYCFDGEPVTRSDQELWVRL